MKRNLAILLVLITIISSVLLFSGCNATSDDKIDDSSQLSINDNEQSNKTEMSLPNDEEYVQTAYKALNQAFTITSFAMDDIYKSWYFTIYESGDYSPSGYYYGYIDFAYAEYMGRDYGIVYDAFEKVYDKDCTSQWFYTAISKVSTGVPLIIQILKDEGVYSEIETEMAKAKEALKNVNKDNECYEDLMAYYTEMLSFQKFTETPSGSFSGLESTVSAYEKTIQGYKNRLSVYLD